MKAWILSDLHCDHGTVPPPVPPDAYIALIAGEVMNDTWLIETARQIPVVFVCGNHEFYKRDVPSVLEKYRMFPAEQFYFLEND